MPTTNNHNRRTKRITICPKYHHQIGSAITRDHTVNIPVQSDFKQDFSLNSFELNAFPLSNY